MLRYEVRKDGETLHVIEWDGGYAIGRTARDRAERIAANIRGAYVVHLSDRCSYGIVEPTNRRG